MKLRKQVYDLLPQDLEQFPVWEFALDEEGEEGQDEATVRPYIVDESGDEPYGMYIVRARFTLADGSIASGYLTPPPPGDMSLGTIQPVIVKENGQVGFWCGGVAPTPERLARDYSLLSQDASRLFPLSFASDVPDCGGAVKGIIPGFLVLEDWKTGKTRLLK